MNVTVTGASGLIGGRLMRDLLAGGDAVRILSRRAAANAPPGVRAFAWDPMKSLPPAQSVAEADAVIHLAGEPVAQRWTAEARKRIRDSRVLGTRHLVAALSALPRKPEVLVSASAVGYYGDRGDEVLDEASAPGSGFLAEVCREWEAEAARAAELGMRVVSIRIGIVLAAGGGALARMLPAFRAFAGGRLGSGRQWMSWIHIDDLANLFTYVTKSFLRGAVNGTSPCPVTNIEFTRTLAAVLGRPAILSVPGFALKAALGDMAEVLLGGQRVLPRAAQAAGFNFTHPELSGALESLLHR